MHQIEFDISKVFEFLTHFKNFASLYPGYDFIRFEIIDKGNYKGITLVAAYLVNKKYTFVTVNLSSIRNELNSTTLVEHFHREIHNTFTHLPF